MSSETIVVIVVGAVIVVVIALGLAARNSGQRPGPRPRPPYVADITTFPVPVEAQRVVRTELAASRKINAIKKLREHTGLGLADAKHLVEAMTGGHQPPAPDEEGDTADPARTPLADRARALRAERREMDAIRLLCDEAGMSIDEAQKFLDSLD